MKRKRYSVEQITTALQQAKADVPVPGDPDPAGAN